MTKTEESIDPSAFEKATAGRPPARRRAPKCSLHLCLFHGLFGSGVARTGRFRFELRPRKAAKPNSGRAISAGHSIVMRASRTLTLYVSRRCLRMSLWRRPVGHPVHALLLPGGCSPHEWGAHRIGFGSEAIAFQVTDGHTRLRFDVRAGGIRRRSDGSAAAAMAMPSGERPGVEFALTLYFHRTLKNALDDPNSSHLTAWADASSSAWFVKDNIAEFSPRWRAVSDFLQPARQCPMTHAAH